MASTKAKFKVYNGEDWVEYVPSNMVTTDTSQTISGTKTFTSYISANYYSTSDGLYITRGGDIYGDGDGWLYIDTEKLCIVSDDDSSNEAHFSTHALTANRDYVFPNKSGTFALTSDIPSTSSFVTTTGNQNVGGVKTFTASPQILNTTGDAYINFNSDYGGGLLFRGANAGTSYQPNAAVTFNYDTDELTLYSVGGVYCNGGLYETNSNAPYIYGYKYVGKVYYNSGTFTSKCSIHIEITTPYSTTPTSSATLRQALYQAGHTSQANCCPAVGIYNNYQVVGMYASTSTLYVIYITSAANATESYASLSSSAITYSFKKLN